MTSQAPYKPGDLITVDHDTTTGNRVTERVRVLRVVPMNDGVTWRLETERHDGGDMHVYVDRLGPIAVGQLTST